MDSASFDPEKVERLVIADEYHHCPEPSHPHEDEVVVRASDYDQLLALYQQECAEHESDLDVMEQYGLAHRVR